MAEPDNQSAKSLRDFAEEVTMASVGVVALSKERVDELVAELARKGRLSQEEARDLVEGVVGRWRGDAMRFSERAGSSLSDAFRSLGIVTRREHEELELRLAQLEHRLRLIENEKP